MLAPDLADSSPSAYVALPRDFTTHPDELHRGVSERSLQRLKVSVDDDARPFVTLQGSESPYAGSIAQRELAYLLLRSSEQLRRPFAKSAPPPAVDPSTLNPRYLYRRVRSAIASKLIVPRFVTDNYVVSQHVPRQRSHIWFESSRRVLEYQGRSRSDAQPRKIVCYLFAPEREAASEALFWSFVTDSIVEQPNSHRYDEASDLMLSSVLARTGRRGRWYCEIVIAPSSLIAGSETARQHRAEPTRDPSPLLQLATRFPASASEVKSSGDSMHRSLTPSPAIEIGEHHARRAEMDWEFVLGEIEAAVEAGRALDETTIRTIARRRQAHAQAVYDYPAGAGASEASSEEIVRNIVSLYRFGLDPDFELGAAPDHS